MHRGHQIKDRADWFRCVASGAAEESMTTRNVHFTLMINLLYCISVVFLVIETASFWLTIKLPQELHLV